jgi:alcohol dehydrogenase class IV
MIVETIESAIKGDKEARGSMHIAQSLAGMAFSNALLGIVHSLAHKTGAEFKITHGRCNAILLPYVIEYNAKVCANKFAKIAKYLGLKGSNDIELTQAYVKMIKDLAIKLGVKLSYKENGVTEEHYKSVRDKIVTNAVLDPCTGSNPRPTDAEAMGKVLDAAYYGTPINF